MILSSSETLIKYLIGHESKQLSNDKNRIIVAHDISPADALKFKNSNIDMQSQFFWINIEDV